MLKHRVKNILLESQVSSGGFLASGKKDRYPFVYSRDAMFIANALDKLGEHEAARKFFFFLKRVQLSGEWVQRYKPNGKTAVSRERESDCNGLVLNGIWDHFLSTRDELFLKEMWSSVQLGVKYLFKMTRKNGLVYGKHSIHEYKKLEQGYELWANSWACKGLESASKIADQLEEEKKSKLWEKMSTNLLENVLYKFWNDKEEHFIKVIKTNGKAINCPDITMLSPAWSGIIPIDNRIRKTVDFIKDLWDNDIGGYRRFNFFEYVKDWHWYDGGYGPFCVYTIKMIPVHKKLKQKRWKECKKWIRKVMIDGKLPEHVSTVKNFNEWLRNGKEFEPWLRDGVESAKKTKREWNRKKEVIYWAFPLNWSMAELILCDVI